MTNDTKQPKSDMDWFPVTHVTEPRGTYVQVFRNYWWLVNAEGEIAIYRNRVPQCILNEDIAQKLIPHTPGAVDAVLIPLAFFPINLSDYR